MIWFLAIAWAEDTPELDPATRGTGAPLRVLVSESGFETVVGTRPVVEAPPEGTEPEPGEHVEHVEVPPNTDGTAGSPDGSAEGSAVAVDGSAELVPHDTREHADRAHQEHQHEEREHTEDAVAGDPTRGFMLKVRAGPSASITASIGDTVYTLHDDGTAGDGVAGDGVHQGIVGAYRPGLPLIVSKDGVPFYEGPIDLGSGPHPEMELRAR